MFSDIYTGFCCNLIEHPEDPREAPFLVLLAMDTPLSLKLSLDSVQDEGSDAVHLLSSLSNGMEASSCQRSKRSRDSHDSEDSLTSDESPTKKRTPIVLVTPIPSNSLVNQPTSETHDDPANLFLPPFPPCSTPIVPATPEKTSSQATESFLQLEELKNRLEREVQPKLGRRDFLLRHSAFYPHFPRTTLRHKHATM